jgi:hypothetical protein
VIEVEGSVASSAPKKEVVDIIDSSHIHGRDGVFPIIVLAELLLLTWCQALSERHGHRPLVLAFITAALIRANWVLCMSNTEATTTLKNKMSVGDLGDKMLPCRSRAQASLMISHGAALTENQSAPAVVVPILVASIASV